MIRSRLITTLTLILVVTTIIVTGCHRQRTGAERADRMVAKIAKELDLNEHQRAKLMAVRDAFLTARAQVRPEHDVIFNETVAMVQSDHLEQAKVMQLLERTQALQRQAAPGVIARLAEFHSTLTPPQRAKAAEQLKRYRARMHGHD